MLRNRSVKSSGDRSTPGKLLVGAGIGLATFVGLNFWFAVSLADFSWGSVRDYGWLHSRNSTLWMLATLFFATVLVVYRSGFPVRQAVALWMGVLAGVVWIKMATYHPDDMWPISLVLQVGLTSLPIVFGLLAARAFHDLRKFLTR